MDTLLEHGITEYVLKYISCISFTCCPWSKFVIDLNKCLKGELNSLWYCSSRQHFGAVSEGHWHLSNGSSLEEQLNILLNVVLQSLLDIFVESLSMCANDCACALLGVKEYVRFSCSQHSRWSSHFRLALCSLLIALLQLFLSNYKYFPIIHFISTLLDKLKFQ